MTLRRRRSADTMPGLIHTPLASSSSTPLSPSFNNKSDKYSYDSNQQRRIIRNNNHQSAITTASRLLTSTTTSSEDADSLSSDLSYNSAASGTPLLLDAHFEESNSPRNRLVPPGLAPPSTPHQHYYDDCLQPASSTYVPPPTAVVAMPTSGSQVDDTSVNHQKVAADNTDRTRQRSRSLLDFSNFSSGLSNMIAGSSERYSAFGPTSTTRRSQSTGTLLHERKQLRLGVGNENTFRNVVHSARSSSREPLNSRDEHR